MKQVSVIVSYFITVSLLFVLQKPIFVIMVGGYSFGDLLSVMWHGLSMDLCMAGYLTALPALAAIVNIWVPGAWWRKALPWYTGAICVAMAAACTSNAALYPYWGFPLDYTPIFYITTSPSAAMASVTPWQMVAAPVAIAALAAAYFFAIKYAVRYLSPLIPAIKNQWAATGVMTAVCAVLFVAIRGGLTVSTMNLSRVYFSSDMRLNHAAVNPLFSFMYSAAHQGNDADTFRFFDPAEAQAIFDGMRQPLPLPSVSDSIDGKNGSAPIPGLPLATKPDIHLIIAESFSANLLPSMGGEKIAVNLDHLGREGWLFTEAYASSFRTDRALTAVLCAYPGLPTTSLLKYVEKLDRLPSMPRKLKEAGYDLNYYYGGDINFTNVNALLMTSGFDRVVSDKDFPVGDRLSKWGAPDHVVFDRALRDAQTATQHPRLTVIQTSSSHEPFDVPRYRRHPDDRVNAFMYADSVIGNYVDRLSKLPNYDNTLVIIVADHYGAYPPDISDVKRRHRIPLIFTGGAIRGIDPAGLLGRTASQTDIAATVLGMLGISHDEFAFSNDLLDPQRRQFAVFSEPTFATLVDADGHYAQIDVGADNSSTDSLSILLKAYMQILYDDFSKR